jgi:hypothetical protein
MLELQQVAPSFTPSYLTPPRGAAAGVHILESCMVSYLLPDADGKTGQGRIAAIVL